MSRTGSVPDDDDGGHDEDDDDVEGNGGHQV